jgi:hypothetical protein
MIAACKYLKVAMVAYNTHLLAWSFNPYFLHCLKMKLRVVSKSSSVLVQSRQLSKHTLILLLMLSVITTSTDCRCCVKLLVPCSTRVCEYTTFGVMNDRQSWESFCRGIFQYPWQKSSVENTSEPCWSCNSSRRLGIGHAVGLVNALSIPRMTVMRYWCSATRTNES